MAFKSGFIALIGRPNVGKSTLLNRLIGQKVSIVSDKPQTTRNTIMGVLTKNDCQIVFLDTPGIHRARNRLSEHMEKSTDTALGSVDSAVVLIDAAAGLGQGDRQLLERMNNGSVPYYILLNKKDLTDDEKLAEQTSQLKRYDNALAVIAVSAFTGEGVEELEEQLTERLEEGPMYFPEDMVTDQPEQFIAAEFIREKALELLRDEVPHGIGVEIEKINVRENLIDIFAAIYCERKSHKGIIIGKGGAMLKQIGIGARAEIETLFDMQVNLQLWVKVREDWRNSERVINGLGYTGDR